MSERVKAILHVGNDVLHELAVRASLDLYAELAVLHLQVVVARSAAEVLSSPHTKSPHGLVSLETEMLTEAC